MRMRMAIIGGLTALACCAALANKTSAAEKSAAERASAEKSSAERASAEKSSAGKSSAVTPARQQFDRSYAKYRALVKQLTDLQNRYTVATPDERPAMVQQYNDLLAEGNTLRPTLLALAEKAYRANPQDTKLADMLDQAVETQLDADDYEAALRMAQLLIDHQYPKPTLFNLAGAAAFFSNRFDLADTYLKKAEAAKTLNEQGQHVLASLKDYQVKWAREQKLRTAEAKADDLPRVKLTIGDATGRVKGDIVVELFENEAPNTVADFISLVEKKFYDGTPFHRVLAHFMAQGGDPQGNGGGGPGYRIADECFQPNHRDHFRGSLSMAHTAARDSGGSQFFICFVPKGELDGKYTVFGRVIQGLDLLSKIRRTHVEDSKTHREEPIGGVAPDRILKAVVIRKRNHPYVPKTLKLAEP